MSRIDYELYYMSGLPIDLKSKGLGVVYQPTIKDLVDYKLDIPLFSHPFLFDKEMILNRSEDIDKIIGRLGKLEFLIVYDEMTASEEGEGILDMLTKALKLLYRTNDVFLAKQICKIIIDGSILICNDELEFLSDLVVEMLRVNRQELRKKIEERSKQEQQDALMNEFDRREKEYLEKTKKVAKEFTLTDMINVVVHSQGTIDYSRVFDMTVYQIRNSYETLIKKEMFNVNLVHRISPNFKPSENLVLWEENAHTVRSNLNLNNDRLS